MPCGTPTSHRSTNWYHSIQSYQFAQEVTRSLAETTRAGIGCRSDQAVDGDDVGQTEVGSGRLQRQPSLSEQVVEDVRRHILETKLPSGASLPSERELCAHYGVSRTVVREAVKVLTATGLVEAVPGSGLIVGRTDIEDVADVLRLYMRDGSTLKYGDLHEVRMSLEVTSAVAAAERASNEAVEHLLNLCDVLASTTDLVDASRNDFDFHKAIAESTGNDFLVLLFDVLEGALMETRVATFSMDPSRVTLVADAHRKVALGIAEHDPENAAQAMRAHLAEVKATWDTHSDHPSQKPPIKNGKRAGPKPAKSRSTGGMGGVA